jgi:hypothetical protein
MENKNISPLAPRRPFNIMPDALFKMFRAPEINLREIQVFVGHGRPIAGVDPVHWRDEAGNSLLHVLFERPGALNMVVLRPLFENGILSGRKNQAKVSDNTLFETRWSREGNSYVSEADCHEVRRLMEVNKCDPAAVMPAQRQYWAAYSGVEIF